jgi:glutaredoxin 3
MYQVLPILAITFIVYKGNQLKNKIFKKKNMAAINKLIPIIKKSIETNKVFIAHKTYCPYCHSTLNLINEKIRENILKKEDVYYLELDTIEDGADYQDALQEISGQRTVPNIYINNKHIGGNSDLQTLNSTGELDKLLK